MISNIAHRGARAFAPENTLIAFYKAFDMGANVVEIDVRLTKDGIPVVMHDRDLRRTTNVAKVFPNRDSYNVDDFTLVEIKTLDAGSWYVVERPFFNDIYDEERDDYLSLEDLKYYANGTVRVPTLVETLTFSEITHIKLLIELKTEFGSSIELANKTVSLVREKSLEPLVTIQSFDHDIIKLISRTGIRTGILVDELDDESEDVVAYINKIGANDYNLNANNYFPTDIKVLREDGYGVNPWTVNDYEVIERMIDIGVTGIISDFPNRVKEALDE